MAYLSEVAQKAVLSLLQGQMPGALDAVEAFWVDSGSPLSLPSVVTWFEGHNPTVLELESLDFPFVSVIDAGRSPTNLKASWGYQEQEITIFIDWFVVASDAAEVNLVCQRYAQALCEILSASRVLVNETLARNFTQMDYEPAVTLSEASRHSKYTGDDAGGDFFNPDDVDFIKGGRITVTLRV